MRSGLFTIFLIATYIYLKDLFGGGLGQSSGLSLALIVMIMAPLIYLGLWLHNRDRRAEYKRRAAQTVVELEVTGIFTKSAVPTPAAYRPNENASAPPRDFVVFLRPFFADLVDVRNPNLDGWTAFLLPLYRFVLPETVSLDDGLRQVVPSTQRMVAIGTEAVQLGATKITRSDDDWQEAFEELVPRSTFILVVLGVRPGTEWEIGRLVQLGLLHKSLFLLMPLPMAIKHPEPEAFQFVAVTQMLARHGLHLPEKSPAGDEIGTGDAVAFDNGKRLVLHGRGLVKQGVMANTLRAKRFRQCFALMV